MLTDKVSEPGPAAMLVTAPPALIPKLIRLCRFHATDGMIRYERRSTSEDLLDSSLLTSRRQRSRCTTRYAETPTKTTRAPASNTPTTQAAMISSSAPDLWDRVRLPRAASSTIITNSPHGLDYAHRRAVPSAVTATFAASS
jgi:hypothetical protein